MGQAWTTVKFYKEGRQHFTKSGWQEAVKHRTKADSNILETVDLSTKTFVVTGANSGIGYELTRLLAQRNARVVMVCRNAERGYKAREDLKDSLCGTNDNSGQQSAMESDQNTRKNRLVIKKREELEKRLPLVFGDCGVEEDVRNIAKQIAEQTSAIDALVCNAGALLPERTKTRDGKREVTFATHLACGTYLLSSLLLPLLEKSEDPRIVMVTSGGMYTTKFNWNYIASTDPDKGYNGNIAYSIAKRGQVMLCERWAKTHPLKDKVKFVCVHPGWTDTPGVDSAFGSAGKRWLEPLRSLYEGTEGIAWTCVAPGHELESGELYLDRTVQPKHLTNFTKQSESVVDDMMNRLAAEFEQAQTQSHQQAKV